MAQSFTVRHSPLALFLAGAVAVLLFREGALALLHAFRYTASTPFAYEATRPFGIPAIWQQAFLGGVWGVIYGFVEARYPDGWRRWLAAILFGALALSAVAWFVADPLSGLPVADRWVGQRLALDAALNAAWALGAALLLRWQA